MVDKLFVYLDKIFKENGFSIFEVGGSVRDELLGKETIDTNTYGKSTGHSGSYSTNYQQTGRELLTPDEVRLLDNKYALLFIRGERAVKDFKYDILKHPNIELTADGKSSLYEHGKVENAIYKWCNNKKKA